ncbi:MAG: hypothetical protein RL588_1525 [Pseudomonadota bacterium]
MRHPGLLGGGGAVVLVLAIILHAPFASAEPLKTEVAGSGEPEEVQAISVWGQRKSGLGQALSSSEGVVSWGAYADRPILRPGELAEAMPGLAVTQHSGSGKANQYFLRGFNIDHGTDFSVSLDGVPLNFRSHAHGQGYLDLNMLVPELVEQIRYRKGPYAVDAGDFSAAGSARFTLFDVLPEGFAQVSATSDAVYRAVGAAPLGAGGFVSLDLEHGEGPWDTPENLAKGVFLLRAPVGDWAFTALAYTSRWRSTDQIPLRAVKDGRLSRLAAVDDTDGGRTHRFIASLSRNVEGQPQVSLYVQKYDLNLWSNFTYALDDPENGDQFEQAETRWIAGGSVSDRLALSSTLDIAWGGEARVDVIDPVGLYRTRARERLATTREDRVNESSAALWTEALWRVGALRVGAGLRADVLRADVDAGVQENAGVRTDTLLGPRLSLAWRLSETVEIYGNLGRGYHSNDARGALARLSPEGDPLQPASLIAPADGVEVGIRRDVRGLSLSATLWALKLGSELVYSGDAGDTSSTSATRRVGLEVLGSWSPSPDLNLDISGAVTQARYLEDTAGGRRVPNALDYVVTAGASYRMTPSASANLTVRHLGPAALAEDNSVRSGASTLVNMGLTYRWPSLQVSLDVLNLLDSADNDITYFYASRLPGEAEPYDDFHIHPLAPRQFRLVLKRTF